MAPVSKIIAPPDQAKPANPDAAAPGGADNPAAGPQGAPAGPEPAAQPSPSPDAALQNMVPGSRLKEEADRRRAAEQAARDTALRLAQLEGFVHALQQQPQVQPAQPQPPADPHPLPQQYRSASDFMIADPDGYHQWIEDRTAARVRAESQQQAAEVNAQLRNVAWQADDVRAAQLYGAEFVASVKEYVKSNPELSRRFSKSLTPYSDAAKWAREEQVRRAIPNGDVNAARINWLREALSNPELLKEIAPHLVSNGAAPAATPAGVPPSLGAMPRTASAGPVMTTEDAINSLFASRRG